MNRRVAAYVLGFLAIAMAYWFTINFLRNPEIQSLPYYTFRTLLRISITLGISLLWGVTFGMLASMNRVASMILIPFIDLLQSIPILGYFPAVILFFVSVFQGSELAVELSAILLLFTSMAWAVFFGVLGAVKGIPTNVIESARSFGLRGFKYIRHVVFPAVVPAAIAGATLAWCDGWFFMIAAEYIQYAGTTYFVPGLGSYLAKASYVYNDLTLAVVLLVLITSIVVYINALTWHRLMERTTAGTYKPMIKIDLSGVGQLGVMRTLGVRRWLHVGDRVHWPRSLILASHRLTRYTRLEKAIALALTLSIVIFSVYIVANQMPSLSTIQRAFLSPPAEELPRLPMYIALTMGRLGIAYSISLTLALVMGILAAEHKRFAAIFYPLYDLGQAVPILALFPILYKSLSGTFGGIMGLEITCIVMLVLDMIWYMFLNIVSAIKNIPSEIREVGHLFSIKGLKRLRNIVIPSILPAIVTGSLLSWGTGWNTIIFSEYMPYEAGEPLALLGLGSYLDRTGYKYGNTVILILILGVIATIVFLMEGLVWRRLLRKFERYRIEV